MELFKLLGIIAIENTEAVKALRETSESGEKAESKLSNAFDKIGSAAVKVGQVVATGVGAAATAIGTLTTMAVNSYADYEQLVGGVETLFKDSANIVLGYAEKAYSAAGLSANEYMETVTSFSASLIQGLGGDTNKAAEMANMAIVDMSDNANKMGSSMESIQNAYQGFAKQNYNMLDNLKLGYGGTQQEMYRLLCRAQELEETFDADFSIDKKGHLEASFADIVEAIHIVQKDMGIMNTTALEAEKTISGSAAAMKSAWKNLVTGMADENADVVGLIDNLSVSVETFGKNILPRIEIALKGIGNVIQKALPKAMEKIPSILMDIVPKLSTATFGLLQTVANNVTGKMQEIIPILVQKGAEIMGKLGEGIEKNLPEFASKALDALHGFADILTENLPILIEAGLNMIKNIVKGIINSLPVLIEKAPELISKFANLINDNAPKLLQAGIEIILCLGKGIIQAIPELIANIPKIIAAIVDVWEAMNWMNLGKKLITGITNGIKNTFSLLKGNVNTNFTSIVDTIVAKMNNAMNVVQNAITRIKNFFNFNWSLPRLKMPHFRISGGFSLNPPSVPHFSVDWYKKAMNDPMIMNSPTAFGINSKGQIMAGGEAGSEVVSGTDTLMNMISSAVAAQNEELTNTVSKLFAFLQEYLPEMSRMQLVMDSGAVIGELAPGIDKALGRLAYRNGRGV